MRIDEMDLMRAVGERCERRARDLAIWRDRRDKLVLRLVDRGRTWREVADAAQIPHTYIAELKKRRNGAWTRVKNAA